MLNHKKMNKYAGLREYIISAVLVALFFVCFVYFLNYSAVDNGGRNILTDPILNGALNNSLTNMTNQLNAFGGNPNNTASSQLASTTGGTLDQSFGNMVLTQIGGAWTAFTGTVTGIYNVMGVLLFQLGIPPFVWYTLMGCVIISLIFFGWRMIRLGT